MTDAGGLHCPNCGAAVDPDARRCPYCRARLATASCPSCFSLMFEGTTFCAKCGTARDRGEAASEDACCPACDGPLQRVDVGKTMFLECAACDGAWIDATTFEALCADSEAQAAVLHRYAGRSDVARGPVTYRRCLRCGTMMNRVNFGRLSGAVVDVCRGHGYVSRRWRAASDCEFHPRWRHRTRPSTAARRDAAGEAGPRGARKPRPRTRSDDRAGLGVERQQLLRVRHAAQTVKRRDRTLRSGDDLRRSRDQECLDLEKQHS